jgi:tight adherence protein B
MRGDDDLRDRFAKLRAEDQAGAGELHAYLHRGSRRTIGIRFSAWAASGLAVIIAVLLISVNRAGRHNSVSPEISITKWKSSTDFLLQTHGQEVLGTVPLIIIAIAVFIVVALGFFVVASLLDERSSQARLLRERLSAAQKPAEREPGEELALLRDGMLSKIPVVDELLRRSQRVSQLQNMLSQADMTLRAGTFLALCILCGIALGGVLLFVYQNASYGLLLGWVGLIFGFFLPYGFASHRRTKRFEKFQELFPEAIDTLARAVRAGHAFTTALEMIGAEVSEPVAGEFRKLFEEQKFGLPVRDALLNLTERVPLVDVKFFVTAVMLQRETGGNLAEILDNLSYVIRERFKIMRQVRVYTAQGRLTMVLLMALPPVIVIIMLMMNPGFIRPLFYDPIGHTLVVAGITLQTIGYFVIRKVVRIQV